MANQPEEQFHSIYSAYFREIFSYLAYSVESRSQAEDLTQDVFLKAYRSLDSFRGDSDIRTWLYAIARNTLRSYYTKKRPLLSGDEPLQYLMADDPQPEQVVTRQEHQRVLQEALLKLNEMQRTIVIVRYIHGFSTKETARILACTETNVKVQLFRALRKLRKILTEDSEWMLEETIVSKEVRSL